MSLNGFQGEFTHTIDSKGRFIMPQLYRELLCENAFVLTRGLDGCLFAYALKEWENVLAKIAQLPGNKKDTRDFKRYFVGGAMECEIDKQGRCLIPPNLREFANIKTEDSIVIQGVGEKLELWDKETWNRYNNPKNINAESIVEGMDFLGI